MRRNDSIYPMSAKVEWNFSFTENPPPLTPAANVSSDGPLQPTSVDRQNEPDWDACFPLDEWTSTVVKPEKSSSIITESNLDLASSWSTRSQRVRQRTARKFSRKSFPIVGSAISSDRSCPV